MKKGARTDLGFSLDFAKGKPPHKGEIKLNMYKVSAIVTPIIISQMSILPFFPKEEYNLLKMQLVS